MRILHCLRAPVGGLFRHVLDLAAAQAELGHAVGMIADSQAADSLTEQRLAAIAPKLALGLHRVAMARAPGPSDVKAHRAITALTRPLKLDILHGHGAKGGAYARLAARALKAKGQPVKAFYTPHGGTLNYAPASLEGRIFIGLEKILDRLTDERRGIFTKIGNREAGIDAGTFQQRLAFLDLSARDPTKRCSPCRPRCEPMLMLDERVGRLAFRSFDHINIRLGLLFRVGKGAKLTPSTPA